MQALPYPRNPCCWNPYLRKDRAPQLRTQRAPNPPEFAQSRFSCSKFGIGPAPHRVSRPFGPGTPEESEKESRKSPPECVPQSPERVRSGVSKESEKSESALLWDSGSTLFGLFQGFRARRARETLFGAGPILSRPNLHPHTETRPAIQE